MYELPEPVPKHLDERLKAAHAVGRASRDDEVEALQARVLELEDSLAPAVLSRIVTLQARVTELDKANEALTILNKCKPLPLDVADIEAERDAALERLRELEEQEPIAHLCTLPTKDAGPTKFFTAPSDPRGYPVFARPVPAAHTVPDKTALRDLITSHLTCVYVCTRVWEAWSVGTMTEADFIEAAETDFADDLIEAMLPLLAAAPTGEQG